MKRGRSRKVIRENTRELIDTYQQTGQIGNTRPRSLRHAARIASAIAHDKARRRRKARG